MIGEHIVRSNVKVVFDSNDEMYPKARLMYKVKWFVFSKWIEVNSCSQTDHNYIQRTPRQMVAVLISRGHSAKYIKKADRKLKYQLRSIND